MEDAARSGAGAGACFDAGTADAGTAAGDAAVVAAGAGIAGAGAADEDAVDAELETVRDVPAATGTEDTGAVADGAGAA